MQSPEAHSGLLSRKKKKVRRVVVTHRIERKAAKPEWEKNRLRRAQQSR